MEKLLSSPLTSNHSKLSAIRNPEGIWINTSMFTEEGRRFLKNGYYTSDPWGSPGWKEYWEEQHRRCKEGYQVGGVRITGHHYGYLNFAPIERLDISSIKAGSKAATKHTSFPDFWDGDYNYFHALDIARNGILPLDLEKLNLSVKVDPLHLTGARHLLVGKARRKGYSFKNAWVCANNYNTIRGSLSLIGAFDKVFLYGKGKGTMVMASNYLNFLNKHTGWAKKRDFVDKIENKRASYKLTTESGAMSESGYMSEILALTFKDNPDAARGKDPYTCLLEEIGAWPGFKSAWAAISPGLTDGMYMTGQMIGFGTGGDMESGTLDFAEMYYNPELFNLLPFMNIWDEDAEQSTCSFFHPMQWNRVGYYDEQGNSDVKRALEDEKTAREEIMKLSSGSGVLEKRMQEFPTCPKEAFLTVSTNNFPVVELRNRLNRVVRENLHIKKGQPVSLYRDEFGQVKAKPDLEGKLNPIWHREAKTDDKAGAVVIFEYPEEGAPKGLYKVGYDPYRQDQGTSNACIIVYKGTLRNSATRDSIVAFYYGRPGEADEVNRIFELLIELYNTEGMYENEVTHVKSYFQRRNKLQLLAAQPDAVISANIKNSGVSRVYGCHMVDKLKDAGEAYINRWLRAVRDIDENGNPITNIDLINWPGILEGFISFNRKGNFDEVMAYMQVMIQIEEEELGKVYVPQGDRPVDTLSRMIDNMFKKN